MAGIANTYSKVKTSVAVLGALKGLNQNLVLTELTLLDGLICKESELPLPKSRITR